MYVVRSIFTCKPGRAKELVGKFQAAAPHLREMGIRNTRILTDTAAGFWTVVVESEVESLDDYFDAVRQRPSNPDLEQAMGGYMDCVTGGRREILRVE